MRIFLTRLILSLVAVCAFALAADAQVTTGSLSGRVLNAQQEGVAALCAAAGFGFGVHRTDRAPETALLALHAGLGRS